MKHVTGEIAWAAMGLGIVAYEIVAPDDQLLSEAVDRFLLKHPHITRAAIVLIAAHLLNLIPNRYDPIHHTASVVRLQRKYLDRRTLTVAFVGERPA